VAELIEMPFGMWTRVGPRKHVLHGDMHIGVTWRIRLNRPYATAMRPFVKLFLPLVISTSYLSATQLGMWRTISLKAAWLAGNIVILQCKQQ